MNGEFEKGQNDLQDRFGDLTEEMKGKVSDHAENLKVVFHQDLKN